MYGSDLAGALTTGHLSAPVHQNGLYPDIGLGTMPLGSPSLRAPSPSPSQIRGKLSEADLRRMSIESSVLKKKVMAKTESESGDSSSNRAGSEPLIEAEGTLEGLGFGVENGDTMRMSNTTAPTNDHSNSAEGSTSSSSHPTSPSPQPRRHIPLAPATGDLFSRNGTHTPDSPAPVDLNAIKIVIDNERGNVYFRDDAHTSLDPPEEEEEVKGIEAEQTEFAEPVFASLAHTPEQLKEIAKMREEVVRAQRGRKRLGEGAVPPLIPSPSNSPLPLERE